MDPLVPELPALWRTQLVCLGGLKILQISCWGEGLLLRGPLASPLRVCRRAATKRVGGREEGESTQACVTAECREATPLCRALSLRITSSVNESNLHASLFGDTLPSPWEAPSTNVTQDYQLIHHHLFIRVGHPPVALLAPLQEPQLSGL